MSVRVAAFRRLTRPERPEPGRSELGRSELGRSASNRSARALLAPLAVAAVLAGAAVVTVERSGCDDPARYVVTGTGVHLVGGCVSSHDVPWFPAPDADSAARRG